MGVPLTRVAIIPARGGSRRIPHKNIRAFHGRPMLAWPLAVALDSGLFQRVVVSTDDSDIASVARAHGAEVPFLRPAALADDHVTVLAVMRYAVDALRLADCDLACCIYPTAPFLEAADLRQGCAALAAQPDKQFALAVTSFPYPVQRALRLAEGGGIDAVYPEHRLTRSQDLEPAYHDAGQFCWGRVGAWRSETVVLSRLTLPVLIPRHRAQDIDTLEDWRQAELMFAAWRAAEQGAM